MRLWHQDLIKLLPREQLLGQHRECCALRGNGWGKKHSVVDYVFTYSPYKLYQYHLLILNEMKNRGYKPSDVWFDFLYRGKSCESYEKLCVLDITYPIYKEHNVQYLKECLCNLKEKEIFIDVKKIPSI